MMLGPQRLLFVATWTILLTLALACRGPGEKRKKTPAPPAPTTLENNLGLTIVPLVEGGIYAVAEADGVIWYVYDGKAIRVKGLPEGYIRKISPATEGGAYVHFDLSQTSGLWYLRGDTASKVTETPKISENKPNLASRERWLWTMWQQERLMREEAEERASPP